MKSSMNKAAVLAAAGMMLMAAPATAQNTTDATETVDTVDTAEDADDRTVRREDNDFPWGLLGLLGLAGLLPRKRKEADIHVDARHDTTRR